MALAAAIAVDALPGRVAGEEPRAAAADSAAVAPETVPIVERLVDEDHDGRYESLDVDATLRLRTPGEYLVWLPRLVARGPGGRDSTIAIGVSPGSVLDRHTRSALRAIPVETGAGGLARVRISFDGEDIGRAAIDGPWRVALDLSRAELDTFLLVDRFVAVTRRLPAKRFGWESFRVASVRPRIQDDGEIRLAVEVQVFAPGPVELSADAHWPFHPSFAEEPADQRPPIRLWDHAEVARACKPGRRQLELVLRLHDEDSTAVLGITADSLSVNLDRMSVLRSWMLAWTSRPDRAAIAH